MIPFIKHSWNNNYRDGEQINDSQEFGMEGTGVVIEVAQESLVFIMDLSILVVVIQNTIKLQSYTHARTHTNTQVHIYIWWNVNKLYILYYHQFPVNFPFIVNFLKWYLQLSKMLTLGDVGWWVHTGRPCIFLCNFL